MTIQTFIFFDLETTGLIQGKIMPKITEIALVAVTRESIYNNGGNLPRILHKLVLPINPKKIIPAQVAYITSESKLSFVYTILFNKLAFTIIKYCKQFCCIHLKNCI